METKIDGHFWVMRNGKIIDTDFEEYEDVCKMWGLKRADKHYLEAPEMTQKLMIEIFLKPLKSLDSAKGKSFQDICEGVYKVFKKIGKENPRYGCCFCNCLIEIGKNGGEIRFGSLGMKCKNKEEYFYEYGGINYTRVCDFIQK